MDEKQELAKLVFQALWFIDDKDIDQDWNDYRRTEHPIRKDDFLRVAQVLLDAGYRLFVNLSPISDWKEKPDKAGDWWMSAFCEGRYIPPRIMRVLDYQRPERGIEVAPYFPQESIPVVKFVTEYYPMAKWLYIPEPDISLLAADRKAIAPSTEGKR